MSIFDRFRGAGADSSGKAPDNSPAKAPGDPAPFTDQELRKLKSFCHGLRMVTPEKHVVLERGVLRCYANQTISQGYHDEHESITECLYFERPSTRPPQGTELAPDDPRLEKLRFITRHATSSHVIETRGWTHGGYAICATGFLGIPGETIITYLKEHREDSFVHDLLR